MWASMASRVTPPSPKPRDQAKPALVVARALKPMFCRYRTVPMSQGLGMTKQPLSCRRRKVARFSAVVGMADLLALRCSVISEGDPIAASLAWLLTEPWGAWVQTLWLGRWPRDSSEAVGSDPLTPLTPAR